jgi:nitrile hydratase accessory protein
MRQEVPNASLPVSLRESLKDLPGIPMDAADGPVFNEPWEARAFAMTLALHERGVFTWPQWAAALSRQITQARAAGDADLGDTYYQHWLRALESLVSAL